MKRTGVFICHCGINIAGTVDVKKAAKDLSKHPGVVHSEEYVYMCSDPGQNLIIDAIKEKKLDNVVVACCSPTLHETTFRNAAKSAGINTFQCEIANIREQCSWVHKDMDKATDKAIKLTKSAVERVRRNESLEPISIPVTRRALVIGGGISGIQSALDMANSGFEVILLERSPSIGGHMIQLSETFPTLDCSQCILTPKMVEVSKHPKIKLMTYSEIQEVSGYVGNFKVKILKKPTYVDPDKCTLCDECTKVCPVVLDGLQFERLLSASGPTMGKILRPSDHKEPKEVVFIQCVGSRDPELHCAYCSKICCMYTAKHAMLYKHHVHDGQAYVFYIDIRSGGKGYEEFVQRSVEEDGVLYLRGKVSKIFEEKGKIKVWGVDTLSGKDIEIDADMVVLATATRPSKGAEELAKKLKIAMDKDGFLSEAHPKLRPVESVTSGMFLAGAAQAPKDIPEAVAQASGAAAKAISILSQERLFHAPTVAKVNLNLCTGCGMCVQVCPYEAVSLKDGKAEVNEVLCEGCGTCSATCLRAAIQVKNLTPLQVNEMIRTSLGG